MLLPSAFTCDSSQPPSQQPRARGLLFASPPLSPTPSPSTSTSINNLFTTCRALQSMLTTPTQLPSPPILHNEIPSSPAPASTKPSHPKLRLRVPSSSASTSSKKPAPDSSTDRKRITKRAQKEPPRGLNKRRRALDDERACEIADMEKENTLSQCPSTPKRMRRIAPEVLPLGLERSDFHGLHLTSTDTEEPFVFSAGRTQDSKNKEGEEEQEEQEGGEWSTEEDRMLVELVLEKLKLSKSEWQDCARSLGKDKASVGRRWRSLMGAGEVGLKGRMRTTRMRSGLCETWR
ncbi:MYB-like protein [Rutstroemia sp. NJR-2017a WRK4]|nr:MYB-like protein [Rutstroemia sp. NJR-2017a WRK4]